MRLFTIPETINRRGYDHDAEASHSEASPRFSGAVCRLSRSYYRRQAGPQSHLCVGENAPPLAESGLVRLARPPAPFRDGTTVGVQPAARFNKVGALDHPPTARHTGETRKGGAREALHYSVAAQAKE